MGGDAGSKSVSVEPIASADMAKCSVTGAWCQRADMVQFRGQLVGAQGKAMLLEQLQTGANAQNELECPSAPQRLACFFVDSVLYSAFSVGLLFVLGIPLSRSAEIVQQSSQKLMIYGLCLCFCNFVFMVYLGGCMVVWGSRWVR